MDRNTSALLYEMLKSLFALGFIYIYGDWFLTNKLLGPWLTTILGLYQVASVFNEGLSKIRIKQVIL